MLIVCGIYLLYRLIPSLFQCGESSNEVHPEVEEERIGNGVGNSREEINGEVIGENGTAIVNDNEGYVEDTKI